MFRDHHLTPIPPSGRLATDEFRRAAVVFSMKFRALEIRTAVFRVREIPLDAEEPVSASEGQ